jgi:hypothetical protein
MRRKDSNAEPLKFPLKHACLRCLLGTTTQRHFQHRCLSSAYWSGVRSSLLSFFTPVGASSASVEVVEVGLTAAEVAAVSLPVVFSSCTSSSSSSESLRIMILSSPDGPRMSWLRSPKSFLVNSSSRKMQG